jgi:hypothetical protein
VSTTPVLRPLGVGEILAAALAVYRSHALALWRLVVVVVALPAALDGALAVAQRQVEDAGDRSSSSVGVLLALVVVVTVIAALLATSAAYRMTVDAYLGRPIDPAASLRFGLQRLRAISWVLILVLSLYVGLLFLAALVSLAGGVVVGLLVFAVPGAYLFVVWSVATPVVLSENLRGRAALRRARTLVQSRFWPCLGAFLLALLFQAIVAGCIAILVAAIAEASDSQVLTFLDQGVLGLISNTLALPFQVAVTTVLYIDLRVRKEGADVRVLTHSLEPGGAGVT